MTDQQWLRSTFRVAERSPTEVKLNSTDEGEEVIQLTHRAEDVKEENGLVYVLRGSRYLERKALGYVHKS